AWLEPGDALKGERGKNQLAAIERERHDQIRISIDNPKAPRHAPHDPPGLRVDRNPPSNARGLASKAPLPVAVIEHHLSCAPGCLVRLRQPASEDGLNSERPKGARGHRE